MTSKNENPNVNTEKSAEEILKLSEDIKLFKNEMQEKMLNDPRIKRVLTNLTRTQPNLGNEEKEKLAIKIASGGAVPVKT